MRFYEFEAKQLLAKQGVPTRPHPTPPGRGTPLPEGVGSGVREDTTMHSYEFAGSGPASVGTEFQLCPALRARTHS